MICVSADLHDIPYLSAAGPGVGLEPHQRGLPRVPVLADERAARVAGAHHRRPGLRGPSTLGGKPQGSGVTPFDTLRSQ